MGRMGGDYNKRGRNHEEYDEGRMRRGMKRMDVVC